MGIVVNVRGKRVECANQSEMWAVMAEGLGWITPTAKVVKPIKVMPKRIKSKRRH